MRVRRLQDIVDLVVGTPVRLVPRVAGIGLVDGGVWVADGDAAIVADVRKRVVQMRDLLNRNDNAKRNNENL